MKRGAVILAVVSMLAATVSPALAHCHHGGYGGYWGGGGNYWRGNYAPVSYYNGYGGSWRRFLYGTPNGIWGPNYNYGGWRQGWGGGCGRGWGGGWGNPGRHLGWYRHDFD